LQALGVTSREVDVLALVVEGLSNKEIALRLRIQVPTVKNHVHSILEKLQVRRRGEAASAVRVEERI
jgi:DNA-binding NarL/FixJ family response regulator